MKSALADFQAGIDQFLVFLERTEQEQELIKLLYDRRSDLPVREAELLTAMVANATNTKQYIYAVAIISLYGLMERLVDSLISNFVIQLGELSSRFEELPEVIQKNHLPFSLTLAESLLSDKFRTETTHGDIIGNLHHCFSGSEDYKLNGLAFTFHRGNLNLNRITEMLTAVGVHAHQRRISKTQVFVQYCLEQTEHTIDKMNDNQIKSIFDPIDDLVDRRNEVSHGVVQNIESVNLLKERCIFVRAYGVGLFDILWAGVLEYAAKIGEAKKLGVPIVVHNHSIVCFEIQNTRIAVGDLLFALTANNLEPVRLSAILNLQIEGVDQSVIDAVDPVKIGVQISFNAKSNYDYYFLPADQL